jgi:UDP-glucose 4-epimerase
VRALVTGGAGFIGSTLVDRLLERGDQVTVVDDFSSGSEANLTSARATAGDRLDVLRLDIREPASLDAMRDTRADVVFHLAAQADVRVSVADPILDARTNVIGTLHVLEAARQSGVSRVVFASSGGTIYGEPDLSAIPLDETQPRRPVSPYGVSKKVGGDYLFAYRALHGLDYVALALANVYGPRQDPHGEAGVVAIFAGRLLEGQPCTIFGTGEQTRDYVYVDDVADAFVRGGDRGGAALLNIGTSVETSVNELYRSMADAAGVTADAQYAPARLGELDRIALDPSAAGRVLGWQPSVDLATGTGRVLDWFRTR